MPNKILIIFGQMIGGLGGKNNNNRLHFIRSHMAPVVKALVCAHREYQASPEALDPRDQQVMRDHLAIKGLMDALDREGKKEIRVLQAQWGFQDL